ncbi:MAG: class I SAM-dependent methyltransferase, partial [Chloroflexota bacterium]|nr:class I SAM-dependent methyltransferase [Chloroflexota bacterium]
CGTVYAAEYADPSEIYKDGYLFGETEFGLDVRHPRFQEYLAAVGDRRARILERITGATGSLLDVGCGTGEFAGAAARNGWAVQAVEPEGTAAEMTRSRGVQVRTSTLEASGLAERSYDVVSAFHVLEHLPDSPGFLRTLARWARPGGFVAVEVPNYRSAARMRLGAGWVHLRPLEHVVYHQPATLRDAFERAGLEPVAIRTPTWICPPQSLDDALLDLGRPRIRRALKPLSRVQERDGAQVPVPGPAGWRVLRAVERVYARLGLGYVVLGVARAPLTR